VSFYSPGIDDGFISFDGWCWNIEWFEWIKSEDGNLIYGSDDTDNLVSKIKSMFDDILEDL
jgi:hypothetical protein